ncbi:MAG: tetratricopeptide repeat protein [Ignavibacteriaceae bacterium]
MKLKIFTIAAFFLLFLSPLILSQTQSVEDLLKQGDELIDKFDDQGALESFQKAEKLAPNNWEVNWRLSRVYVNLANQMPAKTDEQQDAQLAVYQKALGFANKAVKEGPDKSVTYLRRAIANGKIALFKGVFSVAKVVNAAKDDLEKAIKLGNGGDFIQALCYYVLGRTHAKVSEKWKPARSILGLGWGDIDVAIQDYNTAIKLYPDFRMFYLDLGKAYIREDEYQKAREVLNKVATCTKRESDDDLRTAEAKKLLQEIKDED